MAILIDTEGEGEGIRRFALVLDSPQSPTSNLQSQISNKATLLPARHIPVQVTEGTILAHPLNHTLDKYSWCTNQSSVLARISIPRSSHVHALLRSPSCFSLLSCTRPLFLRIIIIIFTIIIITILPYILLLSLCMRDRQQKQELRLALHGIPVLATGPSSRGRVQDTGFP